jgi:hypothetical protein
MGLFEIFLGQCHLGENVNVAVAAYVKTEARLKLFKNVGAASSFIDTYLRSEDR